ncbi:hypothetical protein Tco_1576527 [Tanacetum coccineum]
MKLDLQSQVADPELWNAVKAKYEKSLASNDSCRYDAFRKRNHDDHQGNDAPLEGEKGAKRQNTSKSSKSATGSSSKQPTKETNTSAFEQLQQQDLDAWVDIPVIEKDEVIPEDETPELINKTSIEFYGESSSVGKRQEDLKHPQPKALVFYGPHRNPNEPLRYLYNKDLFFWKNGNTEEKKYVLSLHKIHATSFPEEDLEEKMIRWVRRVFKTFNEEARFSIQHWKDLWHKRIYKIKHMKARNDPKEVFSDFRIVEVNAIEDMYYLCLNNKVNYHENKLLNSLLTFIRSCVIWERVHDFQLGIKSYQIKINLTTPTLTIPGIKACNPYYIIDEP